MPTDAAAAKRVPLDVVAVVAVDLGGSFTDVDEVEAALAKAGIEIEAAPESRLWRASYGRRVGRVLELAPLAATLSTASGDVPLTVVVRLHPLGVLQLRITASLDRATITDGWSLNEALFRDFACPLFDAAGEAADGATSVRPVEQALTAIAAALGRPGHRGRDFSMNTIQLVKLPPGRHRRAVPALVEQYAAVQGGSVGDDGDPLTSPYAFVRRWDSVTVYYLEHQSQLLAVCDESARSDLVSAFERTFVVKRWLRSVLDHLDEIEMRDVRGQTLDEPAINQLAAQALDLAQLRQELGRQLVQLDDLQIPYESNLARQLVPALGQAFDVPDWKALTERRLQALGERSDVIWAVLDRAYQSASRQQAERLQLLFSGSLAATVMALLPALLSLGDWKRPAVLWAGATVAGLIVIWALAVGLIVRRWRIRVEL